MINDSFSITPLEERTGERRLALQAQTQQKTAASLNKSIAGFTRQLAIKRGLLASQRALTNREAHITCLRARIEEGTYHASSTEIAAWLVENQTHFLETAGDQ